MTSLIRVNLVVLLLFALLAHCPIAVSSLQATSGAALRFGGNVDFINQTVVVGSPSSPFPITSIDSYLKLNWLITSLAYDSTNNCHVILSKPSKPTFITQHILYDSNYPKSAIDELLQLNYVLTDMIQLTSNNTFSTSPMPSSSTVQWIAVMTKSDHIVSGSVSIHGGEDFPNEEISHIVATGKQIITVLPLPQLGWLISSCIFLNDSKIPFNLTQVWYVDVGIEFPSKSVSKGFAQGLIITVLSRWTAADSTVHWIIVMSELVSGTTAEQEYFWMGNPQFPLTRVSQMWPKDYSASDIGYFITSITFTGNDWIVVSTSAEPPSHFNSLEVFNLKHELFDQGVCGSCYSWSSAEMIADRLKITGLSPVIFELSPQSLISCAHIGGCNGALLTDTFEYLIKNGLTTCSHMCTAGCLPYRSSNCKEKEDKNGTACEVCNNKFCENGVTSWPVTYYVSSYVYPGPPDAFIRLEIMINGPVVTCFDLHSNFYTFFNTSPGEIYQSTNDTTILGGHCVEIVGWGISADNIPYWNVRNTWGPLWNRDGYFLFIRGSDFLGFETHAVAGYVSTVPTLSSKTNLASSVSSTNRRKGGGIFQNLHVREALKDVLVRMAADIIQNNYHLSIDSITSIKSKVVNGVIFIFEFKDNNLFEVICHPHRSVCTYIKR